jgi:hypothetical protein
MLLLSLTRNRNRITNMNKTEARYRNPPKKKKQAYLSFFTLPVISTLPPQPEADRGGCLRTCRCCCCVVVCGDTEAQEHERPFVHKAPGLGMMGDTHAPVHLGLAHGATLQRLLKTWVFILGERDMGLHWTLFQFYSEPG